MLNKLDITKNWLPRYTGMPLDRFGDYILLTNFNNYVHLFAEQFGCDVYGEDRTMPAATNDAGLSIINFGMGSSNAATVMDLLSSIRPKGVLFLGKCGHPAHRGHSRRGNERRLLPAGGAGPALVQTAQVRFGQDPRARPRLPDRGHLHDQPPGLGT
jgi:hypothetical protein